MSLRRFADFQVAVCCRLLASFWKQAYVYGACPYLPWRLEDFLLWKQKHHNEQLAHACHLVSFYKILVPCDLAPIPHTIVGLFYHLRFKHTRN
jgi:hypothetical protein